VIYPGSIWKENQSSNVLIHSQLPSFLFIGLKIKHSILQESKMHILPIIHNHKLCMLNVIEQIRVLSFKLLMILSVKLFYHYENIEA